MGLLNFILGFVLAVVVCLVIHARWLKTETRDREFHVKIRWIDLKGKPHMFVSEDLDMAQNKLIEIKVKLMDKYLWKK